MAEHTQTLAYLDESLTRGAGTRQALAFAAGADVEFHLSGEHWHVPVSVAGGEVSTSETCREPRFTVRASDDVWQRVLDHEPEPGWQSILHLVQTGLAEVDGDERAFFQHLHLIRAVIEGARAAAEKPATRTRPLTAHGSYARVASALGTSDVYVERCGSGPQLLALATAGSDTSQWHGMITDTDITDRYELITVDLPWHGRSSPIFGAEPGEWHLTPDTYTDFIVSATNAIDLSCPVLVGASMAGAAVIHAIATNPTRFAGGVACQVGRRVSNRASARLRSPDIDQSTLVPEWTYGLMNPASPAEFRSRVWWGYSSGGHGSYAADIDSYLMWDFDEIASGLTMASPHIAVLSGRYDTTVPPAASLELAASIPNSSFAEMPELGHFPHAEHPAAFREHLESALRRVLGNSSGPTSE